MKLRCIFEAGMSRRDLLKRGAAIAGGGPNFLKSLMSLGIEQATAAVLTKTPAIGLEMAVSTNYGYPGSLRSIIGDMQKAVKILQTLSGSNTLYEQDSGESDSDSYNMTAQISPDNVTRLLARVNESEGGMVEDDDGTIWFEFVDKERYISGHIKPIENFVKIDNPLVTWWNQWAQYGCDWIDDKLADDLKKSGINISERPEFVKEHIADFFINDPKKYGDPRKYGLSRDHIMKAKKDAEQYRRDMEKFDKDREVSEINPRPDDYIYGSSMHQPMESIIKYWLSVL